MSYLDIWHNIPDELKVFIISMSPFFELRLSIPLGIFYYDVPIMTAFILSCLGNILIILPTIFMLKVVVRKLMSFSNFLNNFFTKLFEKTRAKHTKKFDLYGALALILIVAVPLPGTGAYSGALIAYIFGVPLKRAFPLLSVGVVLAGIIVMIVSGGVDIFV